MGEFLTGISDQNQPRDNPLPASSNFKPNVHLNVTTLHRRSTKPPSKSSNPEVVATQLQALHNHLRNKSLNDLLQLGCRNSMESTSRNACPCSVSCLISEMKMFEVWRTSLAWHQGNKIRQKHFASMPLKLKQQEFA